MQYNRPYVSGGSCAHEDSVVPSTRNPAKQIGLMKFWVVLDAADFGDYSVTVTGIRFVLQTKLMSKVAFSNRPAEIHTSPTGILSAVNSTSLCSVTVLFKSDIVNYRTEMSMCKCCRVSSKLYLKGLVFAISITFQALLQD